RSRAKKRSPPAPPPTPPRAPPTCGQCRRRWGSRRRRASSCGSWRRGGGGGAETPYFLICKGLRCNHLKDSIGLAVRGVNHQVTTFHSRGRHENTIMVEPCCCPAQLLARRHVVRRGM